MLDDIFEIAVDFILDIILEGVIHGAVSRKVPMFIRIILGCVLLTLFLGITALLLMAGIGENIIMLTLLAAFVFIGSIYMFMKKYKESRKKE